MYSQHHAYFLTHNAMQLSTPTKLILYTTLGAVYMLIFIGAAVRATGAGMGCPDWPTCFGLLIPPTSIDEVPPAYLLLPDFYFNVIHTWTEYSNRLFGSFVGLCSVLLLLACILERQKFAILHALVNLVLVGCVGWLGAALVYTKLHPLVITSHLLGAAAITINLTWCIRRIQPWQISQRMRNYLFWICGGLTLQLLLGAQIRAAHEAVQISQMLRIPASTKSLGTLFIVHKTMAVILGLMIVWSLHTARKAADTHAQRCMGYLLLLIGATALIGFSMTVANVAPWAQPFHVVLPILLLSTAWFYTMKY